METLTNYIKNFAFENYEETPIRTPGGNVGDDFLQKVYDTSFMRGPPSLLRYALPDTGFRRF